MPARPACPMLDTSNRNTERKTTVNNIQASFQQKGLVRPVEGRILGGVCAGLGQRFGIGRWPARILFVLILMLIPGSQFLVYPVLWILMPKETYPGASAYAA